MSDRLDLPNGTSWLVYFDTDLFELNIAVTSPRTLDVMHEHDFIFRVVGSVFGAREVVGAALELLVDQTARILEDPSESKLGLKTAEMMTTQTQNGDLHAWCATSLWALISGVPESNVARMLSGRDRSFLSSVRVGLASGKTDFSEQIARLSMRLDEL